MNHGKIYAKYVPFLRMKEDVATDGTQATTDSDSNQAVRLLSKWRREIINQIVSTKQLMKNSLTTDHKR